MSFLLPIDPVYPGERVKSLSVYHPQSGDTPLVLGHDAETIFWRHSTSPSTRQKCPFNKKNICLPLIVAFHLEIHIVTRFTTLNTDKCLQFTRTHGLKRQFVSIIINYLELSLNIHSTVS